MSCYRLDKVEIEYMLQWIAPWHNPGIKFSYYWDGRHTYVDSYAALDLAGHALDEANERSYVARYKACHLEEVRPAAKTFDVGSAWRLDPVEGLKVLNYYSYQTCEFDEWKQSKAYQIVRALRSMMISQLPGYEAAPWGIPAKGKQTLPKKNVLAIVQA